LIKTGVRPEDRSGDAPTPGERHFSEDGQASVGTHEVRVGNGAIDTTEDGYSIRWMHLDPEFIMRRALYILAICLSSGVVSAHAEDGPVATIEVVRQHADSRCTSGYLKVDGETIGYSVELPYLDNQPEISAIPVGEYDASLRADKGRIRIQLKGVPGRELIQLHVGNTRDDIRGCIIMGETLSDSLCEVQSSTPVMGTMIEKLFGNANPSSEQEVKVKVKVSGMEG
jgi:hypothetical protein